jgi:hypothetical protein
MIIGVDFISYDKYEHYSAETEFQNSELIFGADFTIEPSHANCCFSSVRDISIVNPVLCEKFVLTSNQDFILNNDTLKSGENLIEYFEYKVLQNHFSLNYCFRSTAEFENKTGYYWFFFKSMLEDNTEVSDSCLVKIFFNEK